MTTVRSDRYWRQWNFINMLPFPCSIKQEYVGTMTEGDLLWGIKKYTHLNVKEAETIFIQNFPRKADYEAVSADADMEDLIQKAMNQNFVPVVDDQKKFIGIITRKSIIEYCYEKLKKAKEPID